MTEKKQSETDKEQEGQRERLTEAWKRRIVVEKGYPETIAERIANRVKALADYMQYGHAIIAFYKQNGNFQLVTGTLISYHREFRHSYDMQQVHSTFIFWCICLLYTSDAADE